MKYPLSIIILIIWALACISWIIADAMKESKPKWEEIGTVQFHEAELKAWKAGECYVFGVDFQKRDGQEHGQMPVFFSNCQK